MSKEKYQDVIAYMSGIIINASDDEAGPLDRMSLACDISAAVLMSYPEEQRLAVLDVFLGRLGNVMDRMSETIQ